MLSISFHKAKNTLVINYQKDGFGPIIKDEEHLVNELCNYMKNNCKIKEKYKIRDNNFFLFDDDNNSKRICNEVDNYLKNR